MSTGKVCHAGIFFGRDEAVPWANLLLRLPSRQVRCFASTIQFAVTQRTGKRGAQESKTASRTELKSEEKKLAKEAVVNGALFQVVEKLKGEVTQLKSELAGATARSV